MPVLACFILTRSIHSIVLILMQFCLHNLVSSPILLLNVESFAIAYNFAARILRFTSLYFILLVASAKQVI